MHDAIEPVDLAELRRARASGPTEDIASFADNVAMSVPPRDLTAATDFIVAINALSFEHRQILLLVGLEGLSYREIAQELGLPQGTVMSRLARARKRLQIYLTGTAAENRL